MISDIFILFNFDYPVRVTSTLEMILLDVGWLMGVAQFPIIFTVNCFYIRHSHSFSLYKVSE